jgi:hypothetical protein
MEAPKNQQFAHILKEIVNTLEDHLIGYFDQQHKEGFIQNDDFPILAKMFYSLLYQASGHIHCLQSD